MKRKALLACFLSALLAALPSCNGLSSTSDTTEIAEVADTEAQAEIESQLNLANNSEVTWSYSSDNGAWVMSIVSAVAYPELEDYQGVSVAVPSAYVKGVDTDNDGVEDITADNYSEAVNGVLVFDYNASVTSENGQVYTASTAPVIINTGAAGYSAQENQLASTSNCVNGYINVSCGNRGKQSTATDSDGNTYYTGDAPDCLVDQKNAIRFVKYNILLDNLPGSVDYFVSTGGSGGGAHATMVAAMSNHSDFYDYEASQGAVSVYECTDGTYSTTVTIDGTDYEISDGVWGCIAYSAITSLAEADMAIAFEYYLDTDYSFNTDFQAQLAEYLSDEYMTYINDQNLTVEESAVGFDLNEDGDTDDTIELQIEYNAEKYADTNGYGGTYLTLYLDEFVSNLQWYVDNLDYADGWTWFDTDGNAMSDEAVAAMTTEEKAEAFVEGRYAQGNSSNEMGGMDGMPGGGNADGLPDGEAPDDMADGESADGLPDGEAPDDIADGESADGLPNGEAPDDIADGNLPDRDGTDDDVTSGMGDEVGTPDAETTQGVGSSVDSENYSSFDEMLEAYETDIAAIEAGDEFGNNQVELYDPLNYIGAEDTENPTWVRILMGASEGDMSMFSSLNLEIAWLNAGTNINIEWQWDGGHVPSEILGESLLLYLDEMYGEYVDGAVEVTKPEAETQTSNGTATTASGTDLSSWVSITDGNVSFSLADAVSYRTAGASKTMPGFDIIDYGQETYEFGDSENDARHFDKYVLNVLQENTDTLSELFQSNT
ncbi:MAG: hypothetical protein LIO74_07775 [Ruminococcus sp.]|nr:hypothetical protein [Ruminococcus sp.]